MSLHGQRYGRLVVLRDDKFFKGNRVAECKCDCGSLHYTRVSNIKAGITTSCGCAQRDASSASNRRRLHRRHRLEGIDTTAPNFTDADDALLEIARR